MTISALRPPLSRLLPIEIVCLAGLACTALLLWLGEYRLYLPHAEGGEITQMHFGAVSGYLRVLGIAFLIYCAGYLYRRQRGEMGGALRYGTDFLRSMLAYCLCLFLMMNFKLWSILSPDLWDGAYMAIDHALAPLLHALQTVTQQLGIREDAYFAVYLYLFIGSYIVSAAAGRDALQHALTLSALIFIVGGLAYHIAPAFGPFLYFSLPGAEGHYYDTQRYMLEFSEQFRASNGAAFTPKDFEAPLGAMPSLHTAHAIGLLLVMWRIHWGFGVMMIPVALYIGVFAMLTGFHYIVDLPAGAVIAIVCYYASHYLVFGQNRR